MRALERWSDISLTVTVPSPWKGEPSRRIAHPLWFDWPRLEELLVDRLEARLVDRELAQRAIRRNDRTRRIRPHVVARRQAEAIRRDGLDLGDARDRREATVEPVAVSLDLDHEA